MDELGLILWGLLGAGYLLLAIGVTGHILLNKRDIGSSIAWMGLAWLSPAIGSLLYISFGINRVERRALRLRRRVPPRPRARLEGVDDRADYLAPLEHAVRQLTARRLELGNAVTLLRNGDEAYPKMIGAIDAATKSVALTSYIFRDDRAGNAFIDALARAKGRGVEVRVLIDGIGGGYWRRPAWRRLCQAGVNSACFLHSWLPWRTPFLNLRNHKKILCVDGRLGFTGGLNIGDENVLRGKPRDPVRDLHFQLEGPIVGQLSEAFADDWLFATGEQLSGAAWFPRLEKTGEIMARVITSGPDHDLEKIELTILQAITVARQSIRILTPYFLPNTRLMTALGLASMRGIAVEIVVPERSDQAITDWARQAQLRPLLVAGCKIWSSPPPFEHSKLMTVDGLWGMIGSANWDTRSLRLNFEQNVEFYHADLVPQFEAIITRKRGAVLTLEAIDGRGLAKQLRDQAVRLLLPYL